MSIRPNMESQTSQVATSSGSAHSSVSISSVVIEWKKIFTGQTVSNFSQKKNERSKKLQLRRKQKEQLRKMVRDLETTEGEIEVLDSEIQGVEREMVVATDAVLIPCGLIISLCFKYCISVNNLITLWHW